MRRAAAHFTLVLLCSLAACDAGPDGSNALDGASGSGVPIGSKTAALIDCDSPVRDPDTDWRVYADQCRRLAFGALAASVEQSQVLASTINPSTYFASVPSWSDAVIRERFRAGRDDRYMRETGPMANDPNFLRRSSWMYPEDGCFARAELLAAHAGDAGVTRPRKLFSFGNLEVETENHPDGFVTWWWHVVPVVRSSTSGVIYVLDPAIEPSRPLPWQTWLLRQVSSLGSVYVTLADTNAYNPNSPVTGGPNLRAQALDELQNWFLILEWDLQYALNREPYDVLGPNPPWKYEAFFPVDDTSGYPFWVGACPSCVTNQHALTTRCFTQCP